MRLPRLHLRLRLRTLLIAVAVLGVALGLAVCGWRMWERREYCLAKAADEARERNREIQMESMATEVRRLSLDLRSHLDGRGDTTRVSKDIAYLDDSLRRHARERERHEARMRAFLHVAR